MSYLRRMATASLISLPGQPQMGYSVSAHNHQNLGFPACEDAENSGVQLHEQWNEELEEEEEEPVFVMTDEWMEFFAKSEAKRRLEKNQAKKKKLKRFLRVFGVVLLWNEGGWAAMDFVGPELPPLRDQGPEVQNGFLEGLEDGECSPGGSKGGCGRVEHVSPRVPLGPKVLAMEDDAKSLQMALVGFFMGGSLPSPSSKTL
ncbi:hypothetical protein NE237_014595 [Protea cynaroides]|uniref:Uncharacterized protein n=1 Tax=Protea cynaroides TaxID=273540 RepID=A0A9Q0KCG6_9MAGN|nr:hypothetical protein NE237_014595 [Protea cynaroides]